MRDALLFAGLCLAGAHARAEWSFTLSDDLTLGKDRYTANTLDVAVAPSRSFGGDVSAGVAKTATPVKDSTNSGGFGLWVNPGPRSSIALYGSRYQGVKGEVYDDRGGYVGEAPDRQTTSSLGVTFSYQVIAPAGEDEDGPTLTASVGGFGGGHLIPYWTQTPGGAAKDQGDFRISDRGLSFGVTGGLGPTTAGLSLRTHRYGVALPAAVDDFIRTHPRLAASPTFQAALFERVNSAVDSGIYGLPMSEISVSLSRRFFEVLTAGVSYAHEKLSTSADVEATYGPRGAVITGIKVTPVSDSSANTVGLSLSWDAATWLTLRAGGSSTRQDAHTSRYGELGVSTSF